MREQVRDSLLERIAEGKLAPGQRIIEARLVEEFDISSTPVREAMRELVVMGVLQARNHWGASVRQVSVTETIEAFEVRAALETLAARAATRVLKGRCEELWQSAKSIVATARSRDFAAFQAHNQVFHRTIVQSADNSVLLKVWDSLFFQIRTKFTMDYLTDVDPVAIAEEHLEIAGAIDSGNIDRSASLLAVHSNHLVEYLRRQQASILQSERSSVEQSRSLNRASGQLRSTS